MIQPLGGKRRTRVLMKAARESHRVDESCMEESITGLNASPGRLSSLTVPVTFVETCATRVLFAGGVSVTVAATFNVAIVP